MSVQPRSIPISPEGAVQALLDAAQGELRALGATAGVYHFTPSFHSQVSARTVVAHFGYPAELIEKYLNPKFFGTNPIPDHVMQIGHPVTWRDATTDRKYTALQKTYLRFCIAAGITHGLSVPLFGANSRNSYSSYAFPAGFPLDDPELVSKVLAITNAAHQKVCELIERDFKSNVRLSRREQEVLHWMAQGKSNNDMATILGVSKTTVDTMRGRLFGKLGVNDRVSAVLVALGRGLIQIGAPGV